MALYTIKCCPHCYYRLGSSTDLFPIKFESPLKVCPKCHKNYIDKDCKELGLYDETPILAKLPMSIDGFIRTGILFCFGALLGNTVGIALSILALLIIVVSVVLLPQKREKIEEETQKSIRRLSNPSYAMALRSAGLHVPEKFINPEKHRMILQNEASAKSCCERCGVYLREEQFKKLDGKVYCNSCYNITLKEKRIGEK